MFCLNCGNELPPDAFFCPTCGKKVETAQDMPHADASGQAVSANGDASEQAVSANGGAPEQAVSANGEAPVKIETYMDFGIIITVLGTFNCGFPFSLILGIAAIYYADKANRNLQSGELGKAKENAQMAKLLCVIATAILAFTILFMFFCFALMILLSIHSR